MQYADRRISFAPATVVIPTRVSVENPSYQVSTARDGERPPAAPTAAMTEVRRSGLRRGSRLRHAGGSVILLLVRP